MWSKDTMRKIGCILKAPRYTRVRVFPLITGCCGAPHDSLPNNVRRKSQVRLPAVFKDKGKTVVYVDTCRCGALCDFTTGPEFNTEVQIFRKVKQKEKNLSFLAF